jgi:hypothetical protein
MKKNNTVKAILLLSLTFILASCGSQKPMVSDIEVSPQYINNDVYVSLNAQLSLGNVTLPQAGFPILMPKTLEEIGMITMQSTGSGKNQLHVEINLSAIAHIEAVNARLPNGSILPLIGESKTIEIPIKDKLSVYVSFGDGMAALGVAIPFKTLDSLGKKVGTTSLFPVFNIKNVFGAAGIYTSKETGKNGFGLFADLTQVMDPIMFVDLGVADKLNLNYSSIVPSYKKEKKINREMYKLHSRRKRLKIK